MSVCTRRQAGAAVSLYTFGAIDVQSVLRLVLGSIGIIAWLNLSNDAFDADTGVDANKAESVVNLTVGRKDAMMMMMMMMVVVVVVVVVVVYIVWAFSPKQSETGLAPLSNPQGNQALVHKLATLFLAAGLLLLISGCACNPAELDTRVSVCLALAIIMGYLYQGPPFRLGYLGLGRRTKQEDECQAREHHRS